MNVSACVCKENYYLKAEAEGKGKGALDRVVCTECPTGGKCAGGTSLPIPREGYGGISDLHTQFWPCSHCVGNFTCDEVTEGKLCSFCKKGYFTYGTFPG